MYLTAKQVHARLAGFLGLFLVIHFAAHFSALGGINAHSLVLTKGRMLYYQPFIEALLITAFAAQIVLGLVLLKQITRRPRKDIWHALQQISGVYLAIFIAAHSGSALIARSIFELDTNFYWAAGTLVVDPLMWGFLPYYTAAVMALMTHLVCAMHFRRARKWHWPALMLSPFIAGAAIAGDSGALFPVTLPAEHEAYFSALASFLR